MKKHFLINAMFLLAFAFSVTRTFGSDDKEIRVYVLEQSNESIELGVGKLVEALKKLGFQVNVMPKQAMKPKLGGRQSVFIGVDTHPLIQSMLKAGSDTLLNSIPKEGYRIYSGRKKNLVITGSDASGIANGCLEAAGRIEKSGKIHKNRLHYR